jgi:hypothetical protein
MPFESPATRTGRWRFRWPTPPRRCRRHSGDGALDGTPVATGVVGRLIAFTGRQPAVAHTSAD